MRLHCNIFPFVSHVYALHIFCLGYESELTVIELLGKRNLRHSGLTGDHGSENTKKDDPGAYGRKSSRCHHCGPTMQLVHVIMMEESEGQKATPSMKSLHGATDSGATSSASFPGFSILSFILSAHKTSPSWVSFLLFPLLSQGWDSL